MYAFVVGIIFAALAIWLIVNRLRLRRRSVQDAIDYVVRSLNSPRNDNHSEVTLNRALPLSDHMVKEIANTRGYRFVSEISRYSNDTLVFAPRTAKRKRLTIDD